MSEVGAGRDPLRSVWARTRVRISRGVGYPLLALALFTQSRWEQSAPCDTAFFLLGCLLVGLATMGRLWSSLFICGYKTDCLITAGPYALTRNPLYLFSLAGAIGVGLATETLTIPILIVLAFALYYPAVIQNEEIRLLARHGARYADYCAAVPRFWPTRLTFREPSVYTVIPAAFRKAMFSALWFVLLLGVLELAEGLREARVFPTLVQLW